MNDLKHIALFDFFTAGHHQMYLEYLAMAFVENGVKVTIFNPLSNEIETRFQEKDMENAKKDMITFQEIPEFEFKAPKVIPPKFHGIDRRKQEFDFVQKQLKSYEKQNNTKFEFVFFSWLDNLIAPLPKLSEKYVLKDFDYKFGGILFQTMNYFTSGFMYPNYFAKPKVYLKDPKCVSVVVIDEMLADTLKEWDISEKVTVFPDFTNTTLPKSDPDIVKEIKNKANGRTIIGLLGGLAYRKGITTLLRASDNLDIENYYFVVIGNLVGSFPEEDQHYLMKKFLNLPENVFLQLEPIKEDEDYNAAVNVCDIIFAGYIDFPQSSNLLTKSAVFKKPIIVSEGFIMEQRVEKYQTGIAVPQKDVEAVVQAIKNLSEKNTKLDFNFDDLAVNQSYEKLVESIQDIIQKI